MIFIDSGIIYYRGYINWARSPLLLYLYRSGPWARFEGVFSGEHPSMADDNIIKNGLYK